MSRLHPDPEHARHGSVLARLIYAYRESDGAYVCVTDVPSGLDADLRCPAPSCRAPLVARKGKSGRTEHFAHYTGRGEECAAGRETSAHLLAKDILAEALRLKLPAVVAEFDGERIAVSPEGFVTFEKAILEHRLGDLVPDVVLLLGEKRLLVEVRVTHPCDEEKIAKLKARNLPAVEIDIRKAQHGDRAAITAEILEQGPRTWLYNAPQEEALVTLRAQANLRQQKAAATLRARAEVIAKTPADPQSTHEGRAAVARLEGLDQSFLTCVEGATSRVFTVPQQEWQALLAARSLIADYSDHWDGTFGVAPHVDWARQIGLVREGLAPRWENGLLEAVRMIDPTFLTATASFTRYFRALEKAGVLETAGKGRWRRAHGFHEQITRQLEETRRHNERCTKIRDRVLNVVALGSEEAVGFEFDAWAGTPIEGIGKPLEIVVRADDWHDLLSGLGKLERTMRYGDDSVPSSIYGLPVRAALQIAVDTHRARTVEAETARQAALQAAAEARLSQVREAFATVVEPNDVEAWLDRSFKGQLGSVREEALAGEEGRDLGLRWVDAESRRQARIKRDEDIAENIRAKLRHAVSCRFDDVHARLWLSTANGSLGGHRPEDYCTNERALSHCLNVLTEQARAGGKRQRA